MEVVVTAYPFVTVYGTLEVPEETDDIRTYVEEHFDEIEFQEKTADFDYCGAEYEVD